jgi:hypothetical protein
MTAAIADLLCARAIGVGTATLTERDIEMFARLGIGITLLEQARVRRVTDTEARRDYGITMSGDMAGIIFPYYIPACDYRVTARLRRDNPEVEDNRPRNKYISAYGDGRHLYFPPGAKIMLANPATEIVLVEAEKSVLALTAWAQRQGQNLLALGLGGCWGWRGRIGKETDPDGERVDVKGPLPDLAACNGRRVYVLLDANVTTNPKVAAAERALVAELRNRHCEVRVCRLSKRAL